MFLLALSAEHNAYLTAFLAAALIAVVGWLLYNSREKRRRTAMKAAQFCRAWGWVRFADILDSYAVGDYSGMFAHLGELVRLAEDEQAAKAEMKRVFYVMLDKLSDDPDERRKILAEVAKDDADVKAFLKM